MLGGRVRGRVMHARTQPKRISIKHRIIRVNDLPHSEWSGHTVSRLRLARWPHRLLLLRLSKRLLWRRHLLRHRRPVVLLLIIFLLRVVLWWLELRRIRAL